MLPTIHELRATTSSESWIDSAEAPEPCELYQSLGISRTPHSILTVVEGGTYRRSASRVNLQLIVARATTVSSTSSIRVFQQEFCKGCSAEIIGSIPADLARTQP